MIDLTHKTIVILGIPHALALGSADIMQHAGAKIIFAVPQGTASPAGYQCIDVNLNDPAVLLKQLENLETFHSVVLSPGWYVFGDFMESSNADWDNAIQQNFEQMVCAMQAVAKYLIMKGNGGQIIILSSVMTLLPFMQASAVGTTLTALWAVAKMAAVDLGVHHITVNIIAAGWIETEWSAPYLHPKGREFVQQGIPLGEIGIPEDVGRLCAFLASDLARYISGAVIPVDGGYILTQSEGESAFPSLQ